MHQRRKKWRINADLQKIADRTGAGQDARNPADSARKETAERTERLARRQAIHIRDGDRARISKALPREPRDAAPHQHRVNPSDKVPHAVPLRLPGKPSNRQPVNPLDKAPHAVPLRLPGKPSNRHRVRALVLEGPPLLPQAADPDRAAAGRSVKHPPEALSLLPLVKSLRRREIPKRRMPLPTIGWRAEIRSWKRYAPGGLLIKFGWPRRMARDWIRRSDGSSRWRVTREFRSWKYPERSWTKCHRLGSTKA